MRSSSWALWCTRSRVSEMSRVPDFKERTKQTLAKRAGQVCSNPECRRTTSGPHSEENKAINLGEAAHIRAARSGQARYDASMTDKERAEISNGIWLCKECARKIDLDEAKYSVAILDEWKSIHKKWILKGKSTTKDTGIPPVDIQVRRVTTSPEFAQFEIQVAFDIVLHNKSNAIISNINILRTIISGRNRQKIAIHHSTAQKLKPFHKTINVLSPAESSQIFREHSPSYEFMRINVTYKNQYNKLFRCTFEGDRDGVRLTKKEALGQT